MKTKDIIGLIFLIAITLYFGGTLLTYFRTGESFGVTEILLIIGLLVVWGETFTWRTRREVQKDEMGKTIIKNSSNISYYVVFISLLILWIIDFFFINKGENYTLFIALCIAYITKPIIQFFLVKKYI
ncbi:hypothetical protein U2I54_22795 [Bacillus pseudomycoides]|uniref:DUF2178 domain-containing protein n=1 Tax=Bacillus bingmayongensis TaxID=1150157 RepID=A0ABU5K310_9BACI|nr:hypothetical protein [Bacillus pseudomycoides]